MQTGAEMLISIVTGTYNRLPQLSAMISSARRQVARMAYEFVIVDGGSADGTLEWLRKQSDVRLIEHGELRGAIRAFCDGARAARGQYVLLANDDIRFKPYSILAALRHLETTPTCGAVAFADNRTSRMHGSGTDYRVEAMGAQNADGTPTMVAYAQVGLFRRALGDEAGWWGDADRIMGGARTYGGDNYLSSRLWEMDYSVDAVAGATVADDFYHDALRLRNAGRGPADSALYYQRYPNGPRLTPERRAYPVQEQLRILYAPIYEAGFPMATNREYGMGQAFARRGLTVEVDWLNEPHDWAQLAAAWRPHLVVTQIQGAGERFTSAHLRAIRAMAPGVVIVNWNGDAHEAGLISSEVIDILRHVDLQTTVNAKVLDDYRRLGIPAAYWQIAYKDPVADWPEAPSYDVLFQGNCYNEHRTKLVQTLRRLAVDGVSVGIYGNCPTANGNTHYDFAHQAALNRRAKIVIGDIYPGTVAFVSNRMFQVLSQGGFLLNQHAPRLTEFTGLIPGQHYAEWTDLDDLMRKAEYYLTHSDERERIAAAGMAYVRQHYSMDAQVDRLFNDLLPGVLDGRA